MTRAPRHLRGLRTVAAATLLCAGLSGCSALETLTAGSNVQPPGVFTLTVGDCLDDASVGDQVTSVPIVACSQEHDSEVFATSQVTDSAFPGSPTLDSDLRAFCSGDVFTQFVGVAYTDSALETRGYYPTVESWASGDRELLCTIYDPSGRTTGSLAGTAR
ncbi:MAG: septum formation family protein [Pseudolysinimonas sp.]